MSLSSNVCCQGFKRLSSVRKHVGQLPAERGDLRETGAAVSGCPWWRGELRHVCVRRHRYIIHSPGGDLLPVCHRYNNVINLKTCLSLQSVED